MREGWEGLPALVVLVAFGLMAFSCEGKAPIVHMCKDYTDQASCEADELCKWKRPDPSSTLEPDILKPAKCKAK